MHTYRFYFTAEALGTVVLSPGPVPRVGAYATAKLWGVRAGTRDASKYSIIVCSIIILVLACFYLNHPSMGLLTLHLYNSIVPIRWQ